MSTNTDFDGLKRFGWGEGRFVCGNGLSRLHKNGLGFCDGRRRRHARPSDQIEASIGQPYRFTYEALLQRKHELESQLQWINEQIEQGIQ